jgi:cytochrome c-type biogenesis protein CcmF
MDAGEILLVLAGASSVAGVILRYYRSDRATQAILPAILFSTTFISLTLCLMYLSGLFLSSDMTYSYVWDNSSRDLAPIYKLSGVWAGAQGSFLLWTWMMSAVLFWAVVLERKRKGPGSKFQKLFQITIALNVLVYVLIMLNMDVFSATDSLSLFLHPDGAGMSLQLQTIEMATHPPVIFAAYASCTATFAAGLAWFVTSDKKWVSVSFLWSRLTWFFLTLGIGLGALWAYYVIGWGGYWSWDPIETSSLVPWLMIATLLHVQVRHARMGEYPILAPTLAMLTLPSVIFVTFITRAGGLWSSAVHDYGSSGQASAGARFISLLSHDPSVLSIFTLLVLLLALTFVLAARRYAKTPRPEPHEGTRSIRDYLNDQNTMLLTVFLMVLTSILLILLLVKNVGSDQGQIFSELNQKATLCFLAIVVTLVVCLSLKAVGQNRVPWLVILLAAATAASAIVSWVTGGLDMLVSLVAPSCFFAIVLAAYRIARSFKRTALRRSISLASSHLVHLGVALVLLSYSVSSNMQVFPEEGPEATVNVGELLTAGDYSIRVVSLTINEADIRGAHFEYEQIRTATVDIMKSGKVIKPGIAISSYYVSTDGQRYDELDREIHITNFPLEDLYISFGWVSDSAGEFEMKTVPFMIPLWTGFVLLCIGVISRVFTWRSDFGEPASA